MFEPVLSQDADRFLRKADKQVEERIRKTLKRKFINEPVPSDAKFIGWHEGEKVFRIRIGDYRATYKVKYDRNLILISKIDKRPRIYDR